MNDDEQCEMVTDEQLANLQAIFDRDRIIESDEHLLELARLVNEEE